MEARARSLRKKLRQVEELEVKARSGTKLDESQKAKLAAAKGWREELEQLGPGAVQGEAPGHDGQDEVAEEAPVLEPRWANGTFSVLHLEGHVDQVRSITFAGERRVITGSLDKTVCIWDTQSGKKLAHIGHHTGEIHALAFDEVSETLFTGSGDSSWGRWGLDGQRKGDPVFVYSPVTALALPASGQLVTGLVDTSIRLWDTETAQEKSKLAGHQAPIRSLAMAQASTTSLASGSEDGVVKIWDLRTGTCVHNLATVGFNSAITSLEMLDSRLFVGAADAADTMMFDLSRGQPRALRNSAGAPIRTLVAAGPDKFVSTAICEEQGEELGVVVVRAPGAEFPSYAVSDDWAQLSALAVQKYRVAIGAVDGSVSILRCVAQKDVGAGKSSAARGRGKRRKGKGPEKSEEAEKSQDDKVYGDTLYVARLTGTVGEDSQEEEEQQQSEGPSQAGGGGWWSWCSIS